MNRRIRRKKHKEYLMSMVYAVSLSTTWRKILLNAPLGVEHEILPETLNTQHLLYPAVKRYNLQYKVWKDNESNGFVEFVVQSNEFPDVQGSSWNNPHTT